MVHDSAVWDAAADTLEQQHNLQIYIRGEVIV